MIVFLLGAGASVDAGMPTVEVLTTELRDALPNLRDENGKPRAEFREIFDVLAAHDAEVLKNYERFFEWVDLIQKMQLPPFVGLVSWRLRPELVSAAGALKFVIGSAIKGLLASRKTEPAYLARLADFAPRSGRLKVFSLNYDCCLEDACEAAGVYVTTGFDSKTGIWNPALLAGKTRGISLHKLHGSLRWYQLIRSPKRHVSGRCGILELRPNGGRNCNPNLVRTPELVLGPANKIQPDDPFLHLFHSFLRSIERAKTCVLIGDGRRDSHVNAVLDQGILAGASILDVNRGDPWCRYLAEKRYRHLRMRAKEALVGRALVTEVQRQGR
jgi:hypothetical protein